MTMRRWATAAGAAVVLTMTAACGGSGGGSGADDDVASLGTSDDATDDTTEGSTVEATPEDREEAMLAFAECMREQGIDMPDPQMDGDAGVAIAVEGDQVDMDEFEAANEVCQPIMENVLGDIEIDPEQEAEMQEQLLEYAQCMRDHGIDMPDPQFDDDGRITINNQTAGGDDDEFQTADEACAGDMRMFPTGAAPSGGGPSTDESDAGEGGADGPSIVIGGGDG